MVKAGETLALAASRFDFAIWTCEPCNGVERNVKDGAPIRWVNQAIGRSCWKKTYHTDAADRFQGRLAAS